MKSSRSVSYKNIRIVLVAAVLLGLILRLVYAIEIPITNDEGAYLYDGLHITRGLVPYRDFLTKAPFFIYTLAAGVKIFGQSLWVGRGLAIISSLIAGIVLFFLARRILNQRAALFSSTLFLVFPTVAYFTTYTHTQVYQLVWITLAFWVLVGAKDKYSSKAFWLHGALLGLGFLTRKTSLGLLLVTLISLVFLFDYPWKEKFRGFAFTGLGVVTTVFPALVLALIAFPNKVVDMVGGEVLKQATAQKMSLGVVGIPEFLSSISKEFLSEAPSITGDGVLLTILTLVFVGYLLKDIRKTYGQSRYVFFPMIWLITLVLIYVTWIKFRTPYFTEFLPPLTLMAGTILASLWDKKALIGWTRPRLIFALLLFSAVSSVTVYKYPFTGSIPPDTAYEVSQILRDNTQDGDEVLTAVTIIPFLSGNHLPYNLSHPTWYGADSIPDDLLLEYFPPFSDFEEYIQNEKTRYIISESYTEAIYFRRHPEFANYVKESYEEQEEFSLPGGPMLLLKFEDAP